mgnify:FL=1
MPKVGLVIKPLGKSSARNFTELVKILKQPLGYIRGDIIARGNLGKGSKQESRKGIFKRLACSGL